MLNELSLTLSLTLISSIHRLQFGLLGYLILFAPQTFVSQRQYLPRPLPSPFGLPSNIYIFYHYTGNSKVLYNTLDNEFLNNNFILIYFYLDFIFRLHTFNTPINTEKDSSLTYNRFCWHVN